jgi:CheY-like chemotaxis protein
MGRLYAALEGAVAERGELARELERVRAESEDTTSLSQALKDAEQERQRLATALENAVREAEAREAQAIARVRREMEATQAARETEWEAAKRAHAAQLAATQQIAEERAADVARLTTRVSELESGAVAGRGHDTRREGEIARLSAALEAAASRETDLRARLAAREAERVGAIDGELATAREALAVAEAGRARAEERVATLDAELQTVRQALEEAHAELAKAREEIAAIRESERTAVVEAERRQTALADAERLQTELRSRMETAERLVTEISAERERITEEARTHQNAAARAEAKVEALAAERDRLREALARSEAEVARLRTALDTAQTEDARVEGILARERAEQAELGERLAEAEAAVARLEAITVEQRSELAHREAEIVRLSAEHAQLLAERERLLAERTLAEASMAIDSPALAVDTSDLEAAALVSPDVPATVVRSDAGLTVINVEAAAPEQPFVPTGAPVVVVLDGDQGWRGIGLEGHDVAVVKPGATSVTPIQELAPTRILANLTAPGSLTALLALRAGGFRERLWGCIASVSTDTAIALGAIEPVVGPIDPDAIIAALGSYASREGRIVTAGADVDALMSLRQALSRRRTSVSMAWDAKQAREMLGVVRPHAVVVDLGMPKRDGCAIVAATASLDPVPLLVLVTSAAGDTALDFTAVLADPPRETLIQRPAEIFAKLAQAGEGTLPQLAQKPAQKLQVGQGPRWVG